MKLMMRMTIVHKHVRVHSHQEKVEAEMKKIKGKAKKITEQKTNIKDNFRCE